MEPLNLKTKIQKNAALEQSEESQILSLKTPQQPTSKPEKIHEEIAQEALPPETQPPKTTPDLRDTNMSFSLAPDEIHWEGYLHGHDPDLVRVSIFVLILISYAVYQFIYGDSITGIVFILIAITLILHVFRDKEHAEFRVSSQGIHIGHRDFTYKDIESFWIDYHPALGVKEISLHLKTKWHPYLKVPIHDADPVQIRRTMLHYLPEEEHRPTIGDIVARKLRI